MSLSTSHHRMQAICIVTIVGISSLSIAAQSPVSSTADIATRGNPTSAVSTRNGRYVFVSVTNVDARNFTGSDAAAGGRADAVSGIEVFRHDSSSHDESRLHSVAFVRTGSTGANGIALLRGDRTLVVGVGDMGVAFLDVHDLIHGRGTPRIARQTVDAGTFDVVASADGKYVFSSNEYGEVQGQRGSVGVIVTHIDRKGRVQAPETIAQIPAGDVVPSLSLSPDGERLYITSELVAAHARLLISGTGNPAQTKLSCIQRRGSAPRANGYITVVNVHRAISLLPDAIISRVAAGCSPVRLVESVDESSLYVSARGDDQVLVFSPALLERDPGHAFIRAISSGGTAPVGIRLFGQDQYLAVANSNRFTAGSGNLVVLDVSQSASAHEPVTLPAGIFPRNISKDSGGRILYLTNYSSRTLTVLHLW